MTCPPGEDKRQKAKGKKMPITDLWEGFSYKSHQKTAVEWMLQREEQPESGGLLCDEMGLGKTMEVLGTIKNSKKSQTLLLCPKAVIPQWLAAADKSKMNCILLKNSGWHFNKSYRPSQPFIFIINYDKLMSKTTAFTRRWERVVLDEAHRAKNRNGELWQHIFKLNRQTTWCVTATPIINDLKDVRNLFALVGFDKQKLTNYALLCDTVNQACLHRSMDEMRLVLDELPASPYITKMELDFHTEEEAEFYRGIQGNIMRSWRALSHDNITARFALIVRLRQLSVHPQVYINARKKAWVGYERKDWNTNSTKFLALRQKLEETKEEPARWIVFCQFHDEMDMLESYLNDSPAVGSVLMYHGAMSEKEKAATLERTKTELTDKHQVLLVQLQSGGVGLNLQHFSKIVFMSPWWTSALMDQAIGRAVRIGQEKTVEVYMLVLKEEDTMNIDMAMLNKAEGKRGMLQRLFEHATRGLHDRPRLRIRIPDTTDEEKELEDEILEEHFEKIEYEYEYE